MMLAGKWVWLWNWRRCEGGDAARLAERLKSAGCKGALLKAFDGARWFDQGRAWRDIAAEPRANGVSVGGWGYCYGSDPAGEAQRAIETAQYGRADLLVLDVEAEFKARAHEAEELCRRIRDALGPDYPLYFSSFAIARYHRSFPFEVFRRYCDGAAPQVYWNAFRWPVEQSLAWMYEDHAALGLPPERIFPVDGLYQEGTTRYPTPEEVKLRSPRKSQGPARSQLLVVRAHERRDVAGRSFGGHRWAGGGRYVKSGVRAGGRVGLGAGGPSHTTGAQVGALLATPAAPPRRTYTVQAADTLSGIAASFGLDGWQRLYDANRGVIGGDPNRIYPGQVLVVP